MDTIRKVFPVSVGESGAVPDRTDAIGVVSDRSLYPADSMPFSHRFGGAKFSDCINALFRVS